MTAELRLPGTVAEVEASPRGRKVGAFFDLDGTLIAGYSAKYLTQERIRRKDFSASELLRSIAIVAGKGVNQDTFGALMDLSAEAWSGRVDEELEEMGERIFQANIRDQIYPEMRDIVEAHQRRGHTVVLSSSASSYQVEPVARFLGVKHVVCNRFVVEDGILTGDVARPVVYGPGKADAVQAFCAERGIDMKRSYFYADGDEDVALMYLVGKPRPTNPGKHLTRVAEEHGWPVVRLTSRGGGVERLVRAAVGIGSGMPILGLGIGIGLAKRDKRAGINFVLDNWIGAIFAASDVHIEVVGTENAWSHRPAVFLVNHRTTYDGAIAMRVLRKDFTAVAKAEYGKNPIGSVVGKLMDVAWVERENKTAALAALKPIEELASKGLSVLIAPEGTRTIAREVGPFKKGAFRIAMAAGLPIVPIVVRNAEVVGGRNAFALHPGTVQVAVLEPISVEDWKLEELDERIAEVRQLYVDTLANWPG